MECYKQVTNLLDHLYDQRTSSSYTPSRSTSVSQDAVQISQSEANDQVIYCSFLHYVCLVFLRFSTIMSENFQAVEVCIMRKYVQTENH